jgi:hypothetical protein
MDSQFNFPRPWLWLVTLVVALIITGVIAFCWIDESRDVRDAQRYQADAQRYELFGKGNLLLDHRTGKTLIRRGEGVEPWFPKQNEE